MKTVRWKWSGLGAAIATLAFVAACGPDSATRFDQVASGARSAGSEDARALEKAVTTGMNYDGAQVQVTVAGAQVVVAVTNSNLLAATHADRDADASRIAHIVETELGTRPGLASIQAVHVDYYAVEPGKSPVMRDSMDFRRDPSLKFKRDVS